MVFSYDNPVYKEIKEPARRVVEAYQNAARFLDTLQEWVYIETGMVHTARKFHLLAHEMPKRFDVFGDILHERHLMVVYPPTPELAEDIPDMNRVFEIAIGTLDEIQDALEKFRTAADNPNLRPMALKTEDLMMQNSHEYTQILEMWKMYENLSSYTSYDSWVKRLMEGDLAWQND